MSKRTGLGRGIGALIPMSEPEQVRPVDVFFPGGSASSAAGEGEAAATPIAS